MSESLQEGEIWAWIGLSSSSFNSKVLKSKKSYVVPVASSKKKVLEDTWVINSETNLPRPSMGCPIRRNWSKINTDQFNLQTTSSLHTCTYIDTCIIIGIWNMWVCLCVVCLEEANPYVRTSQVSSETHQVRSSF